MLVSLKVFFVFSLSVSLAGAACGSLHKRVEQNDDDGLFFFIESGRCDMGEDDSFVLSKDFGRREYGEHLEVLAKLDQSFRTTFDRKDAAKYQSQTISTVREGNWVRQSCIQVQHCTHSSQITYPKSRPKVVMDNNGWKFCPSIIKAKVPISNQEQIYRNCERGLMEVNLQKSTRLFEKLSFLMSRVEIPDCVSHGWLPASSESQRLVGDPCKVCAPSLPEVSWSVVTKGKRQIFMPLENGRDASVYEQSLKNRPHPWKVQLQTCNDNDTRESLQFQIGCNPVSLIQRALGLFPSTLARESCNEMPHLFEWRIVPHVEKQFTSFKKLTFTSNKKTAPASQPPNFKKYGLRPEQLRSLAWMLSQEATTEPFLEQEIAESLLPTWNWRAEGRVQRPVFVRGGIIADGE